MKLTKGKIYKLYNKKKQSLKKIKQKKITKNSQTFRKYKKLNLARKTIKHFNYNKIGGEIDLENTIITFFGKVIAPESYRLNLQTGEMSIASFNNDNDNKEKITIFGKVISPEIYDVNKETGLITIVPTTNVPSTNASSRSSWFSSPSSSTTTPLTTPLTSPVNVPTALPINDTFRYNMESSGYNTESNSSYGIIPKKTNLLNLNSKESNDLTIVKPSVTKVEKPEKLSENEEQQKDALEAMNTISKYIYKYYLKNKMINDKLQDPIDALEKASNRLSDNIQKKNTSSPLASAADSLASISTPSAPPITPSAPPITPSAPPITPSAPPITPPITPSAPPITPSAPSEPVTTGVPAVVQGEVKLI